MITKKEGRKFKEFEFSSILKIWKRGIEGRKRRQKEREMKKNER